MLLPCRLKTRISTASSATSIRSSASEYPTLGWVNFQSAILGQFCIGGNIFIETEPGLAQRAGVGDARFNDIEPRILPLSTFFQANQGQKPEIPFGLSIFDL